MNKELRVSVKDKGVIFVEKAAILKDISKEFFKEDYKKYLGAKIKNEIFNLNTKVEESMEVEFLDISDVDGYRMHVKTISAVFIMACKRLFPERTIEVQHFLGEGLYVEFEKDYSIDFKDIEKINKEMEKIIEADYSITRKIVSKDKAMEVFIENLKKQPLVVEVWDEGLWALMIEKAIVGRDERVRFIFYNGIEITVIFGR